MNEKEENKGVGCNCARQYENESKGEAERKDANKNESNKGNDEKIEEIIEAGCNCVRRSESKSGNKEWINE